MNINKQVEQYKEQLSQQIIADKLQTVCDVWEIDNIIHAKRKTHYFAYASYCVFVAAQHEGVSQKHIAKYFELDRTTISGGITRISTILIEEHPHYYDLVTRTMERLGIDKDTFVNNVIKDRRSKRDGV